MSSSQPESAPPIQSPDLKSKLDEASSRSRHPQQQDDETKTTGAAIVDKVSHYIPAVKKVLGEREESEPQTETPPKNRETPPTRPDDDPKISQFLKDQHKSLPIDKLEE
ncbi:hypothetical protein B0T16DRAFT_454256 [Cercophora newfieldiana]|uniref:Uncharacterized protein n=1 Tax=Cercophora newfieldiana TaxID=92897 RepID=A0AA39YHV9_9PEZI|nr:hypothetical protein B0T16DRAFT_454256 [Cercophora newfieldiana]